MVAPHQAFDYECWANRRVLNHLRELPSAPERASQLFAHILSGIDVWLTRLRGEDSSSVAIWPTCSLNDCDLMLDAVEAAMSTLKNSLDSVALSRQINYTNQHGLAYVTAIGDVLFHMACHGAYHRGQISIVLTQSGLPPINTDYITFVRESAGQRWKP